MLETALWLAGSDTPVICDLACGTGGLLSRIGETCRADVHYIGVDASAAALQIAKRKHPGAIFHQFDVRSATEDQLASLECDVLVANGLFTVKHTLSEAQMWRFLTETLTRAWPRVRRGIVFNVMSAVVDRRRDDLFHVSYDALARCLHDMAGRHIGFRADYGLYEYTAYALKPDV